MEDQFDEYTDRSETFEDIYNLAVQIDDANLKKLRQELQQVRYEIAETQSKITSLRATPSSDSNELKQSMRSVAELRKSQTAIVAQINNSILNQADTVDRMAKALSTLNAEMTSGNISSQNLASYLTIIEGAITRMTSVSKKSEDFKKLQSAFSGTGIDIDVKSIRSASRDVNKLREDIESFDDSPVRITVDGEHVIDTVGSQIKYITELSKQLAAELNRNITILTEMDGIAKASIVTPSSYTGRLSMEGKPLQRIGSIYDIAAAKSLPSRQSENIPPSEVVRAAFFGAPLFWRGANQQVMTSRNTMEPRGTASAATRARLAELNLTKQAPALHQFGAFEQSTFLDTSNINLINKHFKEFLRPMDPTILSGLKTLESRYNEGEQIRTREQIGKVIRNISADKLASAMDKAYYFQLAKMVALYQQDLDDDGPAKFYMRGRPSLDLSDRQLAILNLVNQFSGTLQTSEITRSLGTGHYQGVASDVRSLLSKGLLSRAIIPPFPIQSAGIPNLIAPQIMAANLLAPNVGLEAAMSTTMIKPLSTTDLGKRVLSMVGLADKPSNIDGDVFLNKFIDNIENILVERQPIRFSVDQPPDPRLWFTGVETMVYGESKLGDRIVYYMEEFVNNLHAIKPEYIKDLLPFIPYFEEAGRKRIDVEALRSGQYNLTDISTAKYLSARSDIYNVLQTPHVSIDKIMQAWATPRRDIFTEDMAGSDLYRKSILWWASGSAGLGVNPQLERYTTNPEQAIQYLNTLYAGYATDKFLKDNADAYRTLTGGEYKEFTHYERSIIIRAMQAMLTRAVPVTSGFDVAANEAYRVRPSMSKSESRIMRDMLFKTRRDELENLITNVPDLGKIIRAIERHNKEVLTTSVVNVAEAGRLKPADAYPLTPDQMANVHKRTYLPSSWRKHAAFFGATPGSTYEDTYRLDRAQVFRDISPDLNILPTSVSAVGGVSYAKQLATSKLPSDVVKFRRQSDWSPMYGFSGRLPWDEILKHWISMGSTEVKTPEAQAELERLLANPQELMKELLWDESDLIKETYGTIAVKTPLFGKSLDLPQAALDDLRKRVSEYNIEDKFAEVESFRKDFERLRGSALEGPALRAWKVAQEEMQQYEGVYNAEVRDWVDQWKVGSEIEDYIINAYKVTSRGSAADFYTYTPATVDKQKVIERMDYERMHGLMDPELVEQYARTIANFRTKKDTGRTFKQGIEALFTGQDWSRELMPELKDLGEQLLLHGFATQGPERVIDLFHRNTWDVKDFSVQNIISEMGYDPAMMVDEDIAKYLQEDPDFQNAVRESFMADQDLTKEQYDMLTGSLSVEMRQLAKKFGHLPEYKTSIEDYVSRVIDTTGSKGSDVEGRYPIGETEIFAEKPERLMSTLPGGYALIDVLKKVAWKEGKKKKSTVNDQKKALHEALIEWRKKDEDEYYFSDAYDDSWITDIDSRVSRVAAEMPVLPSIMPMVMLDEGTDTGRYSFIKNIIGIGSAAGQREDLDNIIKHELMHPLAYEKLLEPGGIDAMKAFYESGHPMFQHSINKGVEAMSVYKRVPFLSMISRYIDQLSKTAGDEELQDEMKRLNPFVNFLKSTSDEGVGMLTSFGEDIAMVMAAYDEDKVKWAANLSTRYGGKPEDYVNKIDFIGDFVGLANTKETSITMPPYVDPSLIIAAMGTMAAIEPGSSRRMEPAGYLALPMSKSEELYRQFEDQYINRTFGPEPLRYLPSGSGIPEGYMGIPGGMMREAEGPFGEGKYTYLPNMGGVVIDRSGTMLGGKAGVMYPGDKQLYSDDQVQAYRQRLFRMMALPEGIPDMDFKDIWEYLADSESPTPIIEDLVPPIQEDIKPKRSAFEKLSTSILGRAYKKVKWFTTDVSTKHHKNIMDMIERMPDISFGDTSKMISSRGMEVPISYILKSEMFGGDMDAMRKEVDRFYISLEEMGVDTSKIKHDIIQQSSMSMGAGGKWERTDYGQAQIFGKARLGDEAGKTEREFADMLRGDMTMGFASVNEQGARFEDTIPRINSHMEKFANFGHKIGDMSWKFTTLQMAALGIFFSMMSIMSLMSTGINLVTGGLGDLESMMKAKAMTGFSGKFTNKEGDVITGDVVDERLGITNADREEAWEIWSDLTATVSTILSGLGTKVVTDPKFIDSAGDFINKFLDTVSQTDLEGNYIIVDKLVNLSETLFETLESIVEISPAIIDMFSTIASYKAPEWVPVIGDKPMLSLAAVAGVISAILMPIFAILTILAKGGGFIGAGIEKLIGSYRWIHSLNVGRTLTKEGVDPAIIKLIQQEIRESGGFSRMALEHPDVFMRTSGAAVAAEAGTFAKGTGATVAEKISETIGAGSTTAEAASASAAEAGAAAKVIGDTSKWKWVRSTLASTAISLAPAAISAVIPETRPVMEPAVISQTFTPAISAATGLGTVGAATVAAPLAVISTAQQVAAPGAIPADGRMIYEELVPKPGILGMIGYKESSYVWGDTGEIVPKEVVDYWRKASMGTYSVNANEIANNITEEPLNSKWTKDTGATFNQTNTFNVTVPVEEISEILNLTRSTARQVGV